MSKAIEAPKFRFCPQCGGPLRLNEENYQKCPVDGWTHYPRSAVASAGVLLNSDQCVLLVRRNREPFIGKLMFPAGFLDYGEDPRLAVVREIREETGYHVGKPRLLDILPVRDDPRESGLLVIFYSLVLLNQNQGTISDPLENTEVGWFNLLETQETQIGFETHRQVFRRLQTGEV